MSKIPIIIDCDPGVDDSYAIALANSYSGFTIKALTPVAGNVAAELTRRNALALAEMLNIDCRVAFGAKQPLYKAYHTAEVGVHGVSGVGTVVFPPTKKAADALPAWDVIYQEAKAAAGRLILFATGPLTNIALTLRKYPDLPRYLAKFCIMGGGTFGNQPASQLRAEFNIWTDPSAAKEVFEKLEVYMVPLDATHQAALSSSDFQQMIALCGDSEALYLLRELSLFSHYNSIVKGYDNDIIHDALAIAALINPEVVSFTDHYVYVGQEGTADEGVTVIDLDNSSGKPANCHVALNCNQPLFATMMKNMCRYYRQKAQATIT